MTTVRRMGVEGAENRALLVEATEAILRDEGYASVTARQVANRAGLKHQLVYYYFRTMDDLVLAVIRKAAESRIDRFAAVLESPQPLRALWALNRSPANAAIAAELLSMAGHRDAIRAEIVRMAEEFRALQVAAITRLMAERGIPDEPYSAGAIVMLMMSFSRQIVSEEALGLSACHAEALALMEDIMRHFDETPAIA
jgi:TetR/AcrR family transcriptional regulator